MAKVRGRKNPIPAKPKGDTSFFPKGMHNPSQHDDLLAYSKRPNGNPERPHPSKDRPRKTLHHYGDKRSGR